MVTRIWFAVQLGGDTARSLGKIVTTPPVVPKFVPKIVIVDPPWVGDDDGDTLRICGACASTVPAAARPTAVKSPTAVARRRVVARDMGAPGDLGRTRNGAVEEPEDYR